MLYFEAFISKDVFISFTREKKTSRLATNSKVIFY